MHKPFHLKGPIGLEYNMDLDDVLNTKRALKDLDFMSVPKYGLTTYPDQPMIDGVKSFQRKNKLRVDGIMKPDGPTLGRLNQTLTERQPTSRPPNPLSKVSLPVERSLLNSVIKPPTPLTRTSGRLDSASTGSNDKAGDQQQAAVVAIPAIVYKMAELLGITAMAAWAWWQAMSAAERGKMRRRVEGKKSDDSEGDDCLTSAPMEQISGIA